MKLHLGFAAVPVILWSTAAPSAAETVIQTWVTTSDQKLALSPRPETVFRQGSRAAEGVRIEVNDQRSFQKILGLGSSLEPTTCWNFSRLPTSEKAALMDRIVDPQRGIGMSLMRITIGTPDFTGDPWYSYCDLPAGETDAELRRFSIERDRTYILPVIKLAREHRPDLRFFASPWSPPGWMKSTGSLIGGKLLREWYPAYARYFVRYVKAYEAEGIPIHAVTVQNEPGLDRSLEKDPRWHYPSCSWTGEDERDFIRDHLGPAFRDAGLKTEIWCHDHNYNEKPQPSDLGLESPRTVLRDPAAAAFVGGVAFHGYVGRPTAMTLFHEEFPGVPLHFTEGSVFGIRGGVELIERLENWASSYNAWVLLLDDHGKPNNGPFEAKFATVALKTATLETELLLQYHVYGQFMKFVEPGSVRIETRVTGAPPPRIAFRTPGGAIVLVAVNATPAEARYTVSWRGRAAELQLPPESVGTHRWAGE